MAESFIDWVGSLLGITEWFAYTDELEGHYVVKPFVDWTFLEGNDSSSPSSTSGWPFYGAYMSIYDASLNPDGSIVQPYPYSGGPIPTRTIADDVIDVLDIGDPEQIDFLSDNLDIAQALIDYINANGLTYPNIEFAKWAAGYLNENQTYTWNNFSDRFITNTAQYKLDSYIRNKYPKFSSIADGLVFFLGSNPKVVAALTKYSGFSKNKIMELATNGSGPNIKLSNESWTTIANGKFNAKISDNTIFLAEENVAMFENTFLDGRAKYSLAFSLMVTILHETVHYGRFINGMPDPNSTYDFGTKFEELGFGFNVDFKLNQPVIYKMYYLP